MNHLSKHSFDQDRNAIIKTNSIIAKMQVKDAALSIHYGIACSFLIKMFKILVFL